MITNGLINRWTWSPKIHTENTLKRNPQKFVCHFLCATF